MFTLTAELHRRRRSDSGGSCSDMPPSPSAAAGTDGGSPRPPLPPNKSPAAAPTPTPIVPRHHGSHGNPGGRFHRRDLSNHSFLQLFHGSGGRSGSQPHMPSLDVDVDLPAEPTTPTPSAPETTTTSTTKKTWLRPVAEDEARLTICQITDVYTLDHFASLKTLLETIRSSQQQSSTSNPKVNRTVSMLTGDFLSPYLLSSVDRGAGMMRTLAATPVDILTWGNHEADIDHKTVCRHVRNWKKNGGTFINSNMQRHEAMDAQVPYEIVEVESEDGTVRKKVGLVAVLSNDPKLYAHFPKPGAFGGAPIDDPWETLAYYEKHLKENCGCDLVIPLEHLYVPENEKTCAEFDFPVILSGHDHHRIDRVIDGTRLIKPGMDGEKCTVLEIVFNNRKGDDGAAAPPKIRSTFVDVASWEPHPELKQQTDRAYDVLLPLRNTELAGILPQYEPLTSKDARSGVCTMGRLVCSLLKSSLEQTQNKPPDAVVLMGGNIRGGEDYEDGSFFSLEMLEAEIKSDEIVGVVEVPGAVLARGIEATHVEGVPIPGWFQYDDGVVERKCDDGIHSRVTHVGGRPLDPNRMYRIATKISDLTNGQSPPLKEYFLAHPEALPSKGDYINIQTELMSFFARSLWRRLWDVTGERMKTMMTATNASTTSLTVDCTTTSASSDDDEEEEDDDDDDECDVGSGSDEGMGSVDESRLRLEVLDRDGDGFVNVNDIHYALREYLGLSVDKEEKTLAKAVHSHADMTGDGTVSVDDFEVFCTGIPKEYRSIPKWANAFPSPISPKASGTEADSILNDDSDSDLEVDL